MTTDATTKNTQESKLGDGHSADPAAEDPRRSGKMPYADYARLMRERHGYWPLFEPHLPYNEQDHTRR